MNKQANHKFHDADDLQRLSQQQQHQDNQIDIYRNSFNAFKKPKKSNSCVIKIIMLFFIIGLLSYAILEYNKRNYDQNFIQTPFVQQILPEENLATAISLPKEQISQKTVLQINKNQSNSFIQNRDNNMQKNVQKLDEQVQQISLKSSQKFNINREVWTFQKQDPNYFQSLVLQNNRRMARLSNFSVNLLTKDNFLQYLSQQRGQDLQQLFKYLRQKMINDSSNLKDHIDSIQKRLILLNILYQRGGIIINDVFTITQTFDWISQTPKNPYINRGNHGIKPKVVGFYAPQYSSQMKKYKKVVTSQMQEVQKNMVLIPTLQNYLLAAQSRAEFIERLIQETVDILKNPSSVSEDIATKRYSYIKINDKDVYYEYTKLASQRVLLKKQKQLDELSKGKAIQHFAIDYYGLNLINCYLGPYKTTVILKSVQTPKKIQSIARFDIKQYEASVGPLRYIKFTTMPRKLNQFLIRMRDHTNLEIDGVLEKGIMKGSYLQKMYFPNANQSFIYENPEKSVHDLNAPKWDSLPRIIWFYWDKGLTNITEIPAEVFLCVLNLRKMAAASNFSIRQVNRTNLKQYMDDEIINKIQQTLANGKMKRFVQTQSDLYRLVLLYKYGGVYLDAATITVQNFDWIVDIARFPSQFIYNRYGNLPSVLLLWNPNFGGEFSWQINKQYSTKAQWRLSYLNGFIAAQKGSQLLKVWLQAFLELFMLQVKEVLEQFSKCGISKFKWTSDTYQYLFGMDVIKCVLGRKQIDLKRQNNTKWYDCMHYYKLWTMSSFLGLFKFRDYTNYDNNDRYGEHYYLTRYPQQYVEGIIGKIHFFIKIIHIERVGFSGFLKNNSGEFLQVTHSQSIFRKYLYDQNYTNFEEVDGKVIVKLD